MAKLYIHNAQDIAEPDPKHPADEVWYGFKLLLTGGDAITSYQFLLDGIAVAPGDTVNGVALVQQATNSTEYVKALVKGGSAGQRCTLTLRYSTTLIPQENRSMYIDILEL